MAVASPASSEYVPLFIRLRSLTTREWLASQDLRRKLTEDAVAQGSNLNEVALQILGRHYGIQLAPTGRKTNPSPDAEELNLRVPFALWRSLGVSGDAAQPRRSRQREALSILHAHYGLRLPVRPRQSRRRRGPAPAAA